MRPLSTDGAILMLVFHGNPEIALRYVTYVRLRVGSLPISSCIFMEYRLLISGKQEVVYTNASKQVLVFAPPPVLTLHLKRFQQVGFSLRKVNRNVEFPLVLDLAPFCSSLAQVRLTIATGRPYVSLKVSHVARHQVTKSQHLI